jgi:hypothetical protein
MSSRKAVVIDGRLYSSDGSCTNASCWPIYDAHRAHHEASPVDDPTAPPSRSIQTGHSVLPTTTAATITRTIPRIRFANQVSARPFHLAPIKTVNQTPSLAPLASANTPGTAATIAWDRPRQLPRSRRESRWEGLCGCWKRCRNRMGRDRFERRVKNWFAK